MASFATHRAALATPGTPSAAPLQPLQPRPLPCTRGPNPYSAPLNQCAPPHTLRRADRLTALAGPGLGGPVAGGTNVSVSGVCLPDVSQAGVAATCRWGAAEDAPTTPVVMGSSGGAIVCSTAAAVSGAAGPTPLYLATNASESEAAAGFLATGLYFEYYALEAVRVAPVAGPVAGGTWIRMSLAMAASEELREQVSLAQTRCRISVGDIAAAPFLPLHASADEIICVSGAAPGGAAGGANVSVSLDGGAWFAPPRPFTYWDARLLAYEPAGGPRAGGTLVTLRGEGFVSDGSECRGGKGGGRRVVLQRRQSQVPLSPPPFLSGDGYDVNEPSTGEQGRGCEGQAASVRCSFGMSGMVRPQRVNSTHATCFSPRAEALGADEFSISLDEGVSVIDDYMPAMAETPWNEGEDGVVLSPARLAHLERRSMYVYFEPPTVSSLLPADGPAAGGFTVTVRGVGFDRLAGQGRRPIANASLCRFGKHVTAVLRVVNDRELVCASPHLPDEIEAWRAAPPPSAPPPSAPPPLLPNASASDALAASDGEAEVGDDATFVPTAAPATHCCAAGGGGAALVGATHGVAAPRGCWAACVAQPSCRYFTHYVVPAAARDRTSWAEQPEAVRAAAASGGSVSGTCALCATCDGDGAVRGAEYVSSWRRVEPALPALLPFALALNGQQFSLNEADATAELGYVRRRPARPAPTGNARHPFCSRRSSHSRRSTAARVHLPYLAGGVRLRVARRRRGRRAHIGWHAGHAQRERLHARRCARRHRAAALRQALVGARGGARTAVQLRPRRVLHPDAGARHVRGVRRAANARRRGRASAPARTAHACAQHRPVR